MEAIALYLEMATYVVTLLGVPVAIGVYVNEHRTQRREREYGTFDALDEKYIEIQQLCIENPELDVFDTPFERPPKLSEQQKMQEEAILLIRISIFERAFLMYQRSGSDVKDSQWSGWELEIKEWLARPNFLAVWNKHGPYFDKLFFDHLNQFIES